MPRVVRLARTASFLTTMAVFATCVVLAAGCGDSSSGETAAPGSDGSDSSAAGDLDASRSEATPSPTSDAGKETPDVALVGSDAHEDAPATDTGATLPDVVIDAAKDATLVCADPGGSTAGVGGDAIWANGRGGTFINNAKVATDNDGNIFVAGDFVGTVNFASTGEAGVEAMTSTGINADIYLVKYNAAGVYQWSKRFGDGAQQGLSAIAVDPAGNVYITGYFNGRVNFAGVDDGGIDDLVAPASYSKAYVAKLDNAGHHIWSKAFGDANGSDYGFAIATDTSGNVVITGALQGTMTFARPDGGADVLTSAGSNDVFVAKLEADGSYLWSRSYGDGHSQYSEGVATDGAGNIYLTGFFVGSINFTTNAGNGLVNAGTGHYSSFVAKLDPDGNTKWSHGFGDGTGDIVQRIAVAPGGDVYLAISAVGDVNFTDSDAGQGNLVGQGDLDVFVAKFNTDGVHQWSHRYGDAALQEVGSIALSRAGDVYVAGDFLGSLDFTGASDGGPAALSSDQYDGYVVKLSASGAYQWSRAYGGAMNQIAESLAIDSCSADPILAGEYYGDITIPRTGDAGTTTLPLIGSSSMFVARLVP